MLNQLRRYFRGSMYIVFTLSFILLQLTYIISVPLLRECELSINADCQESEIEREERESLVQKATERFNKSPSSRYLVRLSISVQEN